MRAFSLGFINNSRRARRLSRLLKPQTDRTTGRDDGSRFPAKSNPWWAVFFLFCLIDRSLGVDEGSTIMGKVAEGKEKTRAKWKNWKIS